MNAVTTTEPVSAQTLEHVLGTGDLSKLSTQQRVEYYAKTCESLGLNPLTRPMKFLSLADWTGIVETELFAQTYKSYGLATIRYPVLEIEAHRQIRECLALKVVLHQDRAGKRPQAVDQSGG